MQSHIDREVMLFSSRFPKQRDYWTNKLSGDIAETDISFDYKKIQKKTKKNIKTLEMSFSSEHSQRLMKISKQSDLSIYIMSLAALKSLIYRYTGNNDITVVSPINQLKVTEDTINNFLFIRDRVDGDMTFKELVLAIRESVLEAYRNQDYPMEKFIEYMVDQKQEQTRGQEETDLFIPGIICALNTIHSQGNISQLEGKLLFLFEKETNRVKGSMSYDASVYEDYYAEQISRHFTRVWQHAVENVNRKISDIPVLSEQEKACLLFDFNNSHAPGEYFQGKTIHEIFAARAEKTPGRTALHCDDKWVTYSQLNETAACLAGTLMSKGVKPDSIAALMIEPSPEMLAGILGIIKAGGAFLPIDPKIPKERAEYMLNDSETQILLTRPGLAHHIHFNGDIVNININPHEREHKNIKKQGTAANILYVIYTSGTTGRPKGTLVKNENLVNYVIWFSQAAALTENDRTILTSSFAFDLGYTSIFPPILTGAELHLVRRETYLITEDLLNYTRKNRITYMKVTPSLFKTVVYAPAFSFEMCRTLRLVVLGGEEMNWQDVEKAHETCPHIRFINHYGPTETTIGSVAKTIDFDRWEEYTKNPVIGSPISNTKVFILDRHLNLLPPGAAGELCISGAGVAKGYLKREQLTSGKFISTPFIEVNDSNHTYQRMYRTGDLARWLPNGEIQFLGRIDHQVKIRGFRIELGEIQAQLLKHTGIKQAVVVTNADKNGDKQLCAYFVPVNQQTADKISSISPQLREYLSVRVPEYMIPSYFVHLDKIPLTPNGKVDRKALPAPEISAGDCFAPPRNQIDKTLVKIWSDVLNLEPDVIGIDADFFGLGGHSLKATIAITEIQKEMNVKVSLMQMFKTPSIRGLSRYIAEAGEDKFEAIEVAEKREYYPLSTAQRGVYIQQQKEEKTVTYNMPLMMPLTINFDKGRLEYAFKKLIERQEAFRISFETIEKKSIQRVHQQVTFEIEYYQVTGDIEEVKELTGNFVRPFDLEKPPLLRVRLVNPGTHYFLMIDTHHIITDGVSVHRFREELLALYKGEELAPLRISYKDYSLWQNSKKMRDAVNRQKNFWLNTFADEIPVLKMPMDFKRPGIRSFEGDAIWFTIEHPLTRQLNHLGEQTETTLFMILLAAYFVLLSRYSHQEDIVVGSPVTGRNHADLQHIIGMFVNMLTIRNQPRQHKTFQAFLEEIKQSVLQSMENQDYHFEELVTDLGLQGDPSRNPLFDVVFSMQNIRNPGEEEYEEENKGPDENSQNDPFNYSFKISRFDLLVYATESGGKIRMKLEYSTLLFKPSTIRDMIKHYQEILQQVVENSEIKLEDINMSHDLAAIQAATLKEEGDFGF